MKNHKDLENSLEQIVLEHLPKIEIVGTRYHDAVNLLKIALVNGNVLSFAPALLEEHREVLNFENSDYKQFIKSVEKSILEFESNINDTFNLESLIGILEDFSHFFYLSPRCVEKDVPEEFVKIILDKMYVSELFKLRLKTLKK